MCIYFSSLTAEEKASPTDSLKEFFDSVDKSGFPDGLKTSEFD